MTLSAGFDAGSPNADRPKSVRSTLVSRNVTIGGHRTSVRLEPEMWSGLGEVCRRERANLHEICTSIATRKQENTSLTAAIRVFAMAYFRVAATEDGHVKAGHGYGVTAGVINGGLPIAPRTNTPGVPAYAMAGGKMDGGTRRF